MEHRWITPVLAGVAALAMTVSFAGQANAQVDFSGKRIEIIIPSAAGGASDLSARFLMPLIAERLPGQPTMVIRNIEGAGSIAGANQFQDRAEPDGTDLMWMPPSAMLNYVFRDPRGHYKVNEWTPILTTSQGAMVYARTDIGVTEAKDLPNVTKELVMGSNTPTSSDIRVLFPFELLGVKVRPIFGMNRGEVHPGFIRGEYNINFDSYAAYHEQILPLVEKGEAFPLFTLGYADENTGEIIRDPAAPDVPQFLEVYEQIHGKPLSGTALDAWKAIFNLAIMTTRSVYLPAGTPQEIVDAYTAAVKQLSEELQTDPELKEQSLAFMGPEPLQYGAAAARNVEGAVNFSDEAFAYLKDWLKREYDISL